MQPHTHRFARAVIATSLLAGLLTVPAVAHAQGEDHPLAPWTFQITVESLREEPDLYHHRRAVYTDDDPHSMDMRWGATEEYRYTPGCPSNNQTYSASGSGAGYFVVSAAGFPDEWEDLPAPATEFPDAGPDDYTGLYVEGIDNLSGTYTTSECMGGDSTGPVSQTPLTEIALVLGHLHDLVDAPVGTGFEYRYKKVVESTTTWVTVFAFKGDSQAPDCELYRHDTSSIASINGSDLASFETSVVFESCVPNEFSEQPWPTVQFVSATSNPGLDPGVLTTVLETIGFTIEFRTNHDADWEPEPTYVSTTEPTTSTLEVRPPTSAIDVCFDFLTLLDRTGARKKLDGALDSLKRKALKIDPDNPKTALRALQRLADDWDTRRDRFLGSFLGDLDDLLAPLPDGLQHEAHSAITDAVTGYVETVDGYVQLFLGTNNGSVDELFAAIEDALREFTTRCFEAWDQTMRHTIVPALDAEDEPNARFQHDGYVNPFLSLAIEDELVRL